MLIQLRLQKTGRRTVSPSPFLYLSLNPQNQAPPTKTRVLMRKAHRCDARGAGPWPTRCTPKVRTAREVPRTERSSRRLPRRARRIRFRPYKRGFWPARRREAMRTRCTPKVRTAREPPDTERSLRRAPRNAAGQVPPTKTRVLMRKAHRCDAY